MITSHSHTRKQPTRSSSLRLETRRCVKAMSILLTLRTRTVNQISGRLAFNHTLHARTRNTLLTQQQTGRWVKAASAPSPYWVFSSIKHRRESFLSLTGRMWTAHQTSHAEHIKKNLNKHCFFIQPFPTTAHNQLSPNWFFEIAFAAGYCPKPWFIKIIRVNLRGQLTAISCDDCGCDCAACVSSSLSLPSACVCPLMIVTHEVCKQNSVPAFTFLQLSTRREGHKFLLRWSKCSVMHPSAPLQTGSAMSFSFTVERRLTIQFWNDI